MISYATADPVNPSTLPKLLIVEDDENLRTQMKWALARAYDVYVAGDRQQALEIFTATNPAVVTLDLGLPPHPHGVEEGFRVLEEIVGTASNAKIIVVTGRQEREHALKTIAEGAYDLFLKPFQMDELHVVVRRAFHVYQLEQENRQLQQRIAGDAFEGMLGTSPQMQEVFDAIQKVAPTSVPVLIVGESGVGKELVARAIHQQSSRKTGPFVTINCSAIPETLIESELFGHEKGAFTGANTQRKGRIELAQGGSLFLDEIGELPLSLQVKLLRFLQERQIERVGGREVIAVDARVMAATNMDLKKAMSEGRFREDLYFRLSVVTISVVPLRERGSDILMLANAMLRRYAAENQKSIHGFTEPALITMQNYGWPGNIRELENRIKRAVIMAEHSQVTPRDLELTGPTVRDNSLNLSRSKELLERELVQRALSLHKWNLTRAASELGVSRPTLYELIERTGISRERRGKGKAPGSTTENRGLRIGKC